MHHTAYVEHLEEQGASAARIEQARRRAYWDLVTVGMAPSRLLGLLNDAIKTIAGPNNLPAWQQRKLSKDDMRLVDALRKRRRHVLQKLHGVLQS